MNNFIPNEKIISLPPGVDLRDPKSIVGGTVKTNKGTVWPGIKVRQQELKELGIKRQAN